MTAKPDIWSEWLLSRRTGGDPEMRRKVLENLAPIRDRVIDGAHLQPGARVLDVGCGDGLIAFGILERYPDVSVTFLDVSAALLEACEAIASAAGISDRCDFVLADAQDLSALPDASFDAVTLRSVLIYVPGKLAAHREFLRVLKPGGYLSYFEPINALSPASANEPQFWGYDSGPVTHLAEKVGAVFAAIQGPDDPMMNFGERDLLGFAEIAGFEHIRLSCDFRVSKLIPDHYRLTWEQWLKQSGNPKIPSVGEGIAQLLSPEEQREFEAHIRPQIESGRGLFRMGNAFMSARKA